jgi:putative membrane protein
MLDLILAVLHHLLVFGLVMMLSMQLAALRVPAPNVRRLASLDAGYGVTPLLILGVGAARVAWGARSWAFYQGNPWFWAKVGTFLLIGLLSIVPTRAFLRWRKAGAAPEAELDRVRPWVRAEALLILPLVAFAAMMARWPF